MACIRRLGIEVTIGSGGAGSIGRNGDDIAARTRKKHCIAARFDGVAALSRPCAIAFHAAAHHLKHVSGAIYVIRIVGVIKRGAIPPAVLGGCALRAIGTRHHRQNSRKDKMLSKSL